MSALFSYRNASPIGPIAYDLSILNDFRHILRLKCYADLPKTDTSVEDYQTETTGVKRIVEATANYYVKINTPNTDAIGREGWRTLLLHKDLVVNDLPYSLKTGYTEGDGGPKLSSGSFELWDSTYAAVNRC